MFRRAAFGAVAALTVGVLAVGCSEDGDTVVGGGATSARPDAFPGSQVDDNNVADDARAATPPDQTITSGPEVFWNSANGQAIVLYETTQSGAAGRNLIAHWFDGTRLQPAVQIRGLRGGAVEDGDGAVQGFKVLWLNTSGNTNQNVAARNGDAIILFRRADEPPSAPATVVVHEDSNIRLWGSYFDVSAASAQASGTVVGGFDTAASVLDNDNQINGANNDPPVQSFGFLSDSLNFTHSFDENTNNVDSGATTTFVIFIYGKNQQSGTGANVTDRFRFLPFDLTAATNTMPTAGGTDLTLGSSSYVAGEGAQIADPFLVHNNLMLWNSLDVGADNDDIVTATVFSTTGVSTQFSLGEPVAAGQTADNTQMPDADDVYGPDSGIATWDIFYTQDGYSNTALAAGNRNPDSDLMLTRIPNVASPTPERLEIDRFTNTVVLTGNEQINGTRGGVVAGSIQTRIDRSGSYIGVLWLQDGTDQNTSGGNATRQTNVLFSRAVQTRTGTSTRTAANSVSTAAALNSPSLGTGNVTTGLNNQAAVNNVRFQEDLAGGQTVAQAAGGGFADRGCSFQGNNLRMNWIYQQLNDQNTATAADERRLSVNGMVVTLGANDTTPPSQVLVSTSEVTIETVDVNFANTDPIFARAYDAGDISRTTGANPTATATSGRVIVFFRSNDNTKTDDTANGAFNELRLYAWENGTVTTVSTNPTGATSDLFQVGNFLGGVAVPVNDNTAQAPSHVGKTLHVYWTEATTKTAQRDLGTRSYDLTKTQPTTGTVTLAERFTPATTAEPLFIDHQSGGNLLIGIGDGFTTVRNNETVGVFFDEDRRLYYQQTSGNATGYYKESFGRFDPALVDNESDRPVLGGGISSPRKCNNLPKTIVLFTKDDTTNPDAVARGQVRVMN